jgi:hypothetical protein
MKVRLKERGGEKDKGDVAAGPLQGGVAHPRRHLQSLRDAPPFVPFLGAEDPCIGYIINNIQVYHLMNANYSLKNSASAISKNTMITTREAKATLCSYISEPDCSTPLRSKFMYDGDNRSTASAGT